MYRAAFLIPLIVLQEIPSAQLPQLSTGFVQVGDARVRIRTFGLAELAQSHASTGSQHDFDYLLGDWEFTNESDDFGKGRGFWSAVQLPGGQILDEFRVVDATGETIYLTTTLRAYNTSRRHWELVGMHKDDGLQNTGTGRLVGNEIHIMQQTGIFNRRVTTLRIRYYNIGPDRFSWTADRSYDGGKTWKLNASRIEARRIGPARTLPPLAVVKK